MLDIEEFSLAAWQTPNAVSWNFTRGRGIIYRGWSRISDAERFYPNELKRKVVEVEEKRGRKADTWGT